MITFDALRSALLSDQPYVELDGLVRAELAAGRLTKQIHDELSAMEDAARATPGFSEDAEEALRDILDALNGFCPARYAYRNPPVLPTAEEIAKLPRWARVAFAARCARRVLPLFFLHRPDVEPERPRTLRHGIHRSEQAAAEGGVNSATITSVVERLGTFDTATAGAAYYAARAVVAARDADDRLLIEETLEASGWADTVTHTTWDEPIVIRAHIRHDFDHLARLAQWQHWTDDTPVPADVFGPLWPEGAPLGWPADPEVAERTDLPIELLSRARILEQMTEDEAVNLFNMINAYYIARTGSRLTMEDLRALTAAARPVEV